MCSVARLSRRVWDAEVAGSNPATPTKKTNYFVVGFFVLIWFKSVNYPLVANSSKQAADLWGCHSAVFFLTFPGVKGAS